MNAISQGVGIAEVTVMAVQAGVDLILVSHLYERQIAAFEALIQAVESGEISEARIDQSVERILRLKQTRAMDQQTWLNEGQLYEQIGTESNWKVAQAVSEKSITLVKDEGQLPLDRNKDTLVIWPEVRTGTEVDEVIPQEMTLGKALSAYIPGVKEIAIGIVPTEAEMKQVLDTAQGYKQVVFGTYNADVSEGQSALVNQLSQQSGILLIVAALRNPYDLVAFPQVKTYIACYENRPLMMKSLAKVLTGELKAQGKLPVTI
jgi:beta-N-acetylhexosaminidase